MNIVVISKTWDEGAARPHSYGKEGERGGGTGKKRGQVGKEDEEGGGRGSGGGHTFGGQYYVGNRADEYRMQVFVSRFQFFVVL